MKLSIAPGIFAAMFMILIMCIMDYGGNGQIFEWFANPKGSGAGGIIAVLWMIVPAIVGLVVIVQVNDL